RRGTRATRAWAAHRRAPPRLAGVAAALVEAERSAAGNDQLDVVPVVDPRVAGPAERRFVERHCALDVRDCKDDLHDREDSAAAARLTVGGPAEDGYREKCAARTRSPLR